MSVSSPAVPFTTMLFTSVAGASWGDVQATPFAVIAPSFAATRTAAVSPPSVIVSVCAAAS